MVKKSSNTGSFNARYMTFKQVAETFILTQDFETIIKNNHTVLMGSRGCGKTTLLKMLHPEAISNWDNHHSKKLFDKIPFYGIYIPADKQWSKQIETFEANFRDKADFVRSISKGLINLNVLIAVCDTFKSLIHIGVNEDCQKHDILLAEELIDLWEIPTPIVPDLYSITQRFHKYVSQLDTLVQRKETHVRLEDYCYWDFVDKVGLAINAFEERFKNFDFFKEKPFKWALCFDELEVAPQWLFLELIDQNFRSRNQKILFKITTIPTITAQEFQATRDELEKKDTFSSNTGDDYEIIKMWVHNSRAQKNWRMFCNEYAKKMLFNKFNKEISPTLFWGQQNYNEALKASDKAVFAKFFRLKEQSEFEEDGIIWYVMKEVAQMDKSFHRYLLRKGVDPLNPVPINKRQVDQVHRKIKPIVLYRYYFKKEDDQRRSRKVVSFNYGTDYIYDLTDGNPRAFVNLFNKFMPEFKLNGSGVPIMIKINTQANIISEFSKEYFYPRVAYYSDSVVRYKGKIITLENMLDAIGNYFHSQYIGEKFTADPFSLIKFDEKCPNEIIKLFNKGLESGGILMVEDEEYKGVRKNVRIYRLSYSLYPYYNLPQRLYAIKNLSDILSSLLNTEDNSAAIQLTLNF